MEIDEAIERAKRWATTARALEKGAKNGGYKFMASDAGDEAEVLETLVRCAESNKVHLSRKL